jgi:hypothetical protein
MAGANMGLSGRGNAVSPWIMTRDTWPPKGRYNRMDTCRIGLDYVSLKSDYKITVQIMRLLTWVMEYSPYTDSPHWIPYVDYCTRQWTRHTIHCHCQDTYDLLCSLEPCEVLIISLNWGNQSQWYVICVNHLYYWMCFVILISLWHWRPNTWKISSVLSWSSSVN